MSESSLRVFWFLFGDRSIASSRLQGYLVHEYLVSRGLSSDLVLAPPFLVVDTPWRKRYHQSIAKLVGPGIAVFQKVRGTHTEHLVHTLRNVGAMTVYVQADYAPSNPIPFLCDVVVCPSEYLAGFYRENGASSVVVIPDPAEFWAEAGDIRQPGEDRRNLRICWIGHRGNWHTLELLREILSESEFSDMDLITVSDHPDADVKWSLKAVRDIVYDCDAGVVPTGKDPRSQSKSSNRPILFMAAGLPVIAGRIPSYEKVIQQGWNGYLAETAEDYRKALRALRNPQTRYDLSTRGYDFARENFSMEVIGRRWLNLFQSLACKETLVPEHSRSSARNEGRLRGFIKLQTDLSLGWKAKGRRDWSVAARCFGCALLRTPLYPRAYRRVATTCWRILRGIARRTLRRALAISKESTRSTG